MIRQIVSIDEELCNGCGKCIPACAEGALRIVNGKARIVADLLCDGLGACLGTCPLGAIKIEQREAVAFDEAAVHQHLASGNGTSKHRSSEISGTAHPAAAAPPSCPSSRFAQIARCPRPATAAAGTPDESPAATAPSELTHWPVQLRLLSPAAPVLKGARLLIAADCVPVAYAGFHSELLRDHAVAIACPKLDDPDGYIEKLAEMIRHSDLAEITVAHMQVPCCTGILHMVLQARQLAERDVLINDVVISVQGEISSRRQIPNESAIGRSCESNSCPSKGVR